MKRLTLHLQLDERGLGESLFVFDGEDLVGRIPARRVALVAYDHLDKGQQRPVLAVEVADFTVEVLKPDPGLVRPVGL